jgi:hypothetical protein
MSSVLYYREERKPERSLMAPLRTEILVRLMRCVLPLFSSLEHGAMLLVVAVFSCA